MCLCVQCTKYFVGLMVLDILTFCCKKKKKAFTK